MVAVAEGLYLPAPAVDVTSEVGVGVRQLVRQDDGSEVLDRRAEQPHANADDARRLMPASEPKAKEPYS